VQLIRIFVSSPGDVQDERDCLDGVVKELNLIYGDFLGLQFRLVKWETDARPGIAEDGQAVLNEQMPNDYEIYLGIMWARVGTPTRRSVSGTVEEFEAAYHRYKTASHLVSILFYFKEAAVPTNVNTEQLRSVQSFRADIESRGVVYWRFSETREFEGQVRIHLHKEAHSWDRRRSTGIGLGMKISGSKGSISADPEVEKMRRVQRLKQMSDLIRQCDAYLQESTQSFSRFASATRVLSDSITSAVKKLSSMMLLDCPDVVAGRKAWNDLSADFDTYNAVSDKEAILYGHSFAQFMKYLSQGMGALLSPESSPQVRKEAESLCANVRSVDGDLAAFMPAISFLKDVFTAGAQSMPIQASTGDRLIQTLDLWTQQLTVNRRIMHEFLSTFTPGK
jgi:hypothetical protein